MELNLGNSELHQLNVPVAATASLADLADFARSFEPSRYDWSTNECYATADVGRDYFEHGHRLDADLTTLRAMLWAEYHRYRRWQSEDTRYADPTSRQIAFMRALLEEIYRKI